MSEEDYKRIYPKSSRPGLFYGTAEAHKLEKNNSIESLSLRPIISNIGTVPYKTSKYLATLLPPLKSWKCNIKNRYELFKVIKNSKIQ